MLHGNNTHIPPQPIHKEWKGVSNNKQDISKWIKECTLHEKLIADRNKISAEEFHRLYMIHIPI